MEFKLKLLCLIPFILLLMGISPNDGLRLRFRYRRVLPTRAPTTPSISSSSVIPQQKCQHIIEKPDKRYISPYVKGPICVRLNESQKLDRLQYVGGYNPRYVAINRREAQQFVSLVEDVEPLPTKHPNPSCNQSDLLSILLKPNQAAVAGDEEFRRSGNNVPSVAGTTTIQQCFDGGSLLEGGLFRRLCTECFAITQLPTGVFPPFINEVICGQSNFCVPGIGACQQKVLRFNFLRFTGNFERDDDLSEFFGVDVFVEELETFEEDIRACCECRLFSFLG
ncbi:hypothetical protein ACROYT_G004375 [Oculina patagonica]